jgi:hypothetical protein
MTNTGRQVPKVWKSHSTRTGATAAPTEDPLSNSATAQPLSRRGNHSDTAFVAPGQLAASPAPRRKRKAANDLKPTASEVSIAATEYQSTANDRPFRVPTRSSHVPATVCPIE